MLRLASSVVLPYRQKTHTTHTAHTSLPSSSSSTSHLTSSKNFQWQPYTILQSSSPLHTPQSNTTLHFCSSSLQMEAETSQSPSPSPVDVKLEAIEATPESFQEFGQVIEASPDGDEFGPRDAQLDLSRGIPRFYIMHLKDRPLKFSAITHHASVTQCLGSIGGHVWYLGVAKPSIVDPTETKGTMGADVVGSHCGHFYVPPAVEDVRVFRITGPKFLKLNRGTWHAGPLFKPDTMDFYNLELSNTNVVDHTTHDFMKKNNVVFLLDE